MTTGERIRQARKSAGMTQAELAHKLGISAAGIAQWEQCGISLHLMPWSAALCHGMRILHRAFQAEYGQMEQHFARQNIQ